MNAIKLSNIWKNDAVNLILQKKMGHDPRNTKKLVKNGKKWKSYHFEGTRTISKWEYGIKVTRWHYKKLRWTQCDDSAADGKGYGGDHRTSNIYICHHAWIHSWYPPLKGSGWWHAEIWVRTWPGPLEVSIFVQHNFSRFCQCWWMSYTW